MKNIIKIFAAIFLVAGFTNTLKAQVTLSGNLAGAELVQVLTIKNTTPLYFGKIGITSGTAGTVEMKTDGTRTAGLPSTTMINTGTPKTVAQFDLTGTPTKIYTIDIPSPITVNIGSGSGTKTMTIDALKVAVDGNAEINAAGATGTLSSGISTFLMSGTLHIASDQVLGVYSGTYPVTVDYQ